MLCLPVTARRLPTTPTPPRWLGATHLYSEDAADLDEAVMLVRRALGPGRTRTRRPGLIGGFFGRTELRVRLRTTTPKLLA
ncbi:hypothetical protein [Mycolicibacterium sp.]|uniref:hypothetical protein n=1 Tax=Mycolicibacterium sp. TaxID=2320850 RepID=UPI00095D7F10|nr:hypothetical protein EB73_13315 [Mycobacterium sp. SWH-M3]